MAVLAGIALLAIPAPAETFVSFNGRFKFACPDTWLQVDYTTAEYYLSRGDPEKEVDFEAVFSEKETFAVFQGQYLVLTVDTVGGLSSEQIDSVLTDLSEEFGRPRRDVTPDSFLAAPDLESIEFDSTNALASIRTDVAADNAETRVNLLIMKFYEHGIANFYFYAPVAEFAQGIPTYRDMVLSLTTEDLDGSLESEPVKVADLEEAGGVVNTYLMLFGGLFVMVLFVLIIRIRARRQ